MIGCDDDFDNTSDGANSADGARGGGGAGLLVATGEGGSDGGTGTNESKLGFVGLHSRGKDAEREDLGVNVTTCEPLLFDEVSCSKAVIPRAGCVF